MKVMVTVTFLKDVEDDSYTTDISHTYTVTSDEAEDVATEMARWLKFKIIKEDKRTKSNAE